MIKLYNNDNITTYVVLFSASGRMSDEDYVNATGDGNQPRYNLYFLHVWRFTTYIQCEQMQMNINTIKLNGHKQNNIQTQTQYRSTWITCMN